LRVGFKGDDLKGLIEGRGWVEGEMEGRGIWIFHVRDEGVTN